MPNPPARISPLLRAVVRRALRPDFFFVNIGANDGISNNPIYPFLRDHGWGGIAVEPLEPLFAELERNYRGFPRVILERAAIAPEPRPFPTSRRPPGTSARGRSRSARSIPTSSPRPSA